MLMTEHQPVVVPPVARSRRVVPVEDVLDLGEEGLRDVHAELGVDLGVDVVPVLEAGEDLDDLREPGRLGDAVREVVRTADRQVPVVRIRPLEVLVEVREGDVRRELAALAHEEAVAGPGTRPPPDAQVGLVVVVRAEGPQVVEPLGRVVVVVQGPASVALGRDPVLLLQVPPGAELPRVPLGLALRVHACADRAHARVALGVGDADVDGPFPGGPLVGGGLLLERARGRRRHGEGRGL